jgi:S1-C subfamily serine protease
MIIGIGPQENQKIRQAILRKARILALCFFSLCFLPIIIYCLFHFEIISSKAKFDLNLELPVALVHTGSGTGTAFLVGETRLLTAKHVVTDLKDGDTVQLIFEKAEPQINATAKILWKYPKDKKEPEYYLYDVAVLELTSPTDLPEDYPRLELGDSEGIATRDEVVIIGFPGGLMSTTSGIISNNKIKDIELFQLDAGAWRGSSGGPLILEETNEVIGMVVAGLSEDFQGINIANKINNIKKVLEDNKIDITK